MKICSICGIPKKQTFHCKRCGRIVCLACFNFVYQLCADCEIKADIDYRSRIYGINDTEDALYKEARGLI